MISTCAGSALMKFPDRETFIARFQRAPLCRLPNAVGGAFARMTTEDVGALYEYLHT
jgi:hypothetical protein